MPVIVNDRMSAVSEFTGVCEQQVCFKTTLTRRRRARDSAGPDDTLHYATGGEKKKCRQHIDFIAKFGNF